MKTLREYIDLVSEEEELQEDDLQEEQEVEEAATLDAIKQIDDLYNDK